ncbi:hypothetical protein RB653_004021 [Dictyostelium firmibasis]|uniref:Transmembrane protein n=1 Tax=Dictyostelium firmibasis TaxID=79012 RepID=A0AAN7YWN1_9MYCE
MHFKNLIVVIFFCIIIFQEQSQFVQSTETLEFTTFDISIKKCLSNVYDVPLDSCSISSGICETGSFTIEKISNLTGQFNLNLYDHSNDCSSQYTQLIFDCNTVINSNITDYGVFNVMCYQSLVDSSSFKLLPSLFLLLTIFASILLI